jgi:hypothetical protein
MDVVVPLLAPPGALAGGGTPRLPSSFCHNFFLFFPFPWRIKKSLHHLSLMRAIRKIRSTAMAISHLR